MTSIAQQQELRAKIWRIANDVRGSVDGWDFTVCLINLTEI